MNRFSESVLKYSKEYHAIMSGIKKAPELPGNVFFLDKGEILAIPMENGDCRFPYGEDGFNFWAYSSGYMHANDGLFSPFLRALEGKEPKVGFFALIDGRVLSLLAVPVIDEPWFNKVDRYTIFSKNSVLYFTEAAGFTFAVRVYVDKTNKISFSICVVNEKRLVSNVKIVTYFNPYLSNSIFESSEDRWFRKCEFKKLSEDAVGRFIFTVNEDISRTESVSNFGVIDQKLVLQNATCKCIHATTSRREFVGGTTRNLSNAKALKQGTFDKGILVTSFTDVSIAGEILDFDMRENSEIILYMSFKYLINSRDNLAYQSLFEDINEGKLEEEIIASYLEMNESEKSFSIKFSDEVSEDYDGEVFTHFMQTLKKQVEFCSLIKGYVQLTPNSLIGIRDVFQALEGMLYFQPEKSKEKIVEAMGYIDPSGRCPRQYGLPKNSVSMPPMDLRQFIDQGCWVINTISSYIKFTGDFDILNVICGYHEIIDDKKKIVKKSEKRDSILDHLIGVMEYLISNQDENTKCIKILYGDWNDALDGLGVSASPDKEFGNGVSVMATLQVYQNLEEMIELLKRLDGYDTLIERYRSIRESIATGLFENALVQNDDGETRILHGWGDNRAYFVGSFNDPDGKSRFGLTSNAFWVLSDLYKKDTSIKQTILTAYENLDSKYGLKTFEPCFYPDAKGVGRIYKLPPGTAENGASYIHATAFAIMSLFKMGEGKKAWDQLYKILPFTHEYVSVSPYVMPNSYGYNEGLNVDGESMQDWQTGSSNVVYKTLIRYVIGLMPDYDGVMIQPASFCPFNSFECDIILRGNKVHIVYLNKHLKNRKITVNGTEASCFEDEYMGIQKAFLSYEEIKDNMTIVIED